MKLFNQIQHNEFTNLKENEASFLKRFYIYQKERFPFLGHGILVASFSFSAISFARICRGANGFVTWDTYLVGIFTTISLFLMVRIFDEFKDAEEDAKYRKHLPLPRGLISFKELFLLGVIIVLAQITVNVIFFPKMLIIYLIVIGYLSLMGKEFFVAKWLKDHQFWYVISHMLIIPLIDVYASGLDWLLEGVDAPKGLLFFFAVSFMNGIVLEVGRKIKNMENEAEGVLTYSALLGANKATYLWLLILTITLVLAVLACNYAGYGIVALIVLSIIFLLCAVPALLFLKNQTKKNSKFIELSSAIWTIAMYFTLGAVPMLQKLFF